MCPHANSPYRNARVIDGVLTLKHDPSKTDEINRQAITMGSGRIVPMTPQERIWHNTAWANRQVKRFSSSMQQACGYVRDSVTSLNTVMKDYNYRSSVQQIMEEEEGEFRLKYLQLRNLETGIIEARCLGAFVAESKALVQLIRKHLVWMQPEDVKMISKGHPLAYLSDEDYSLLQSAKDEARRLMYYYCYVVRCDLESYKMRTKDKYVMPELKDLAEENQPFAQYLYGYYLLSCQDPEAKEWLERAAAQGCEEAQDLIKEAYPE